MNEFSVLHRILALALTLGLIASPAFAEKYGPDDEAETLEAMRPKQEMEVALPPFPQSKDLITVDTGPTSRQHFEIDAKTLTIVDDNIVRYSVVATSSSGSKNIGFEAINCTYGTLRHYAYGTADGKWVRATGDKWQRISSMSRNQLHYTLAEFFFCQGATVAGSVSDITGRIRANRPLTH